MTTLMSVHNQNNVSSGVTLQKPPVNINPADARVQQATQPLITTPVTPQNQTCWSRFVALPAVNRVINAIIWLLKKIFPCLFSAENPQPTPTPVIEKPAEEKPKVKIVTVKLQNISTTNAPPVKPVSMQILLSSPSSPPEPKQSTPLKPQIAPIISSSPVEIPKPITITPPYRPNIILIANSSIKSPTSPPSTPKSSPNTPTSISRSLPFVAPVIPKLSLLSPPAGGMRHLAPAQQSPRKESPMNLNTAPANSSNAIDSTNTTSGTNDGGTARFHYLLRMPSKLKPEGVNKLTDRELYVHEQALRLEMPTNCPDPTAWWELHSIIRDTLHKRILQTLLLDHPTWKQEVDGWTAISAEMQVWIVRLYELYHLNTECVPQIAKLYSHGSPKSTHVPCKKSLGLITKETEIQKTLHSIEELNLTNQNLSKCPDAICLLANLTKLFLANNKLKTAPDISQNTKLKTLSLVENWLTSPPDVRFNPDLEKLYLGANQISTAPEVSRNEKLTELLLSNNPLVQPPDVTQNKELVILDLTSTKLESPPDVRQNPKLEGLYLDNNELTKVDVEKNPKLRFLFLANNQFETPPSILQNPELERMSLSGNYLKAVPDISKNLKLKELNLCTNIMLDKDSVNAIQLLKKGRPNLELHIDIDDA